MRGHPHDIVHVPWWAGYQTCSACNLALFDHLENHSGSLARLLLANETLGGGARLKRISIDAQAADVGVRSNEIDATELFALRDCDDGLDRIALAARP